MAWPLKHLVMLVRAHAAFALRANVEFRFIKLANDAPCPQKAELDMSYLVFLCVSGSYLMPPVNALVLITLPPNQVRHIHVIGHLL